MKERAKILPSKELFYSAAQLNRVLCVIDFRPAVIHIIVFDV